VVDVATRKILSYILVAKRSWGRGLSRDEKTLNVAGGFVVASVWQPERAIWGAMIARGGHFREAVRPRHTFWLLQDVPDFCWEWFYRQ
jgi:hypothetical protein